MNNAIGMQRNRALNLSTSMLTMTSSQTNLFRDELEDKFFRLKEEHLELKKEANNAESQMKYLSAKLTRLLNEKKRLMNKEKTRREIDLEEITFDLQQKLVHLDKENKRLKEKILVLRTQLDAEMSKRRLPSDYSHIHSRTDSGLGTNFRALSTRTSSALVLNRRPTTTESNSKLETSFQYLKHKTTTPSMPLFAFNLLQEAQQEIRKLEEVVAMQQSLIETLHFRSDRSRISKNIDNNLVQSSTTLKTTIEESEITQNFNDSNNFRQTDSDSSRYKEQALKKHNQLMNHHSSGKRISEDISKLIEKLQNELSIEKSKCSELRRKLVEENVGHKGRDELSQRISTLEKENEILRKSLEQCIGSCMTEIDQNFKESQTTNTFTDSQYERELQMQISDLKSQLSRAQNELHNEKCKYVTLCSEHQILQDLYSSVKLKLQKLENSIETSKQTDREETIGSKVNPIGSQVRPNECNRSDHLELSAQLTLMQNERQQLLLEFEDMKEMLQLIQNSITSDQ
jgi:hypothetical protein